MNGCKDEIQDVSTLAHRHSEVGELQAVEIAQDVGRRYSVARHRWDEGNLYRARKRMRVAHLDWQYWSA